jgi:ComF family protein
MAEVGEAPAGVSIPFPRAARLAGRAATRLLDLVLPQRCPLCATPLDRGPALCGACWSALPLVVPPVCDVLGTPFPHAMGSGAVSPAALAAPPVYARARSAALHEGPARRLVHALKFADRHEVAGLMARLMARAGRELLDPADAVLPVPLHPRRLFSRRFNQSAMLARDIARLSGRPLLLDVLMRKKPTRRQVGLTRRQRARNVQGAFAVRDAEAIRGKRLVLVDDVLTTGATVEAAARVLLKAGAQEVCVLTFARVVSGEAASI